MDSLRTRAYAKSGRGGPPRRQQRRGSALRRSGQDLPELAKLSHERPDSLSFCTTGVSGLNHLPLEMFKSLVVEMKTGTALNVIHRPYNGVAQALTALKAGEVQACALPYSTFELHLLSSVSAFRLLTSEWEVNGNGCPDLREGSQTPQQGLAAQ
ncbi:tripartite tricarboxylate transporter substrate-binding protein [Variovorax sp.]|uniref:tripartite tricarboxylate transporter substrate-binding protein n=1 Tax=Variovorax sp. TaxID=1871043 RepID=UPI0025EFDD42|nr:tripartite tricarboxylate transporter substrate-binding protein [Variovorax sp.]